MLSIDLSRVAGLVTRRRLLVGDCATCGGAIFEDEKRVQVHGMLVHRRCMTYRRRT